MILNKECILGKKQLFSSRPQYFSPLKRALWLIIGVATYIQVLLVKKKKLGVHFPGNWELVSEN